MGRCALGLTEEWKKKIIYIGLGVREPRVRVSTGGRGRTGVVGVRGMRRSRGEGLGPACGPRE